MKISKLCSYYLQVKELKDGESKVFTCNCRRHIGKDISVVMVDGIVRQIIETPPEEPKSNPPETYEHMLTVLMIMFGDAREKELTNTKKGSNEANKIELEAFEYAKSWLDLYRPLTPTNSKEASTKGGEKTDE